MMLLRRPIPRHQRELGSCPAASRLHYLESLSFMLCAIMVAINVDLDSRMLGCPRPRVGPAGGLSSSRLRSSRRPYRWLRSGSTTWTEP